MPDPSNTRPPLSPAAELAEPVGEGEAAVVLADLRNTAHGYFDRSFFTDARRCHRAAKLEGGQ